MAKDQKPRSASSPQEQSAHHLGAKAAPRVLTEEERRRYLATMKQQAELHGRTLAALAK